MKRRSRVEIQSKNQIPSYGSMAPNGVYDCTLEGSGSGKHLHVNVYNDTSYSRDNWLIVPSSVKPMTTREIVYPLKRSDIGLEDIPGQFSINSVYAPLGNTRPLFCNYTDKVARGARVPYDWFIPHVEMSGGINYTYPVGALDIQQDIDLSLLSHDWKDTWMKYEEVSPPSGGGGPSSSSGDPNPCLSRCFPKSLCTELSIGNPIMIQCSVMMYSDPDHTKLVSYNTFQGILQASSIDYSGRMSLKTKGTTLYYGKCNFSCSGEWDSHTTLACTIDEENVGVYVLIGYQPCIPPLDCGVGAVYPPTGFYLEDEDGHICCILNNGILYVPTHCQNYHMITINGAPFYGGFYFDVV